VSAGINIVAADTDEKAFEILEQSKRQRIRQMLGRGRAEPKPALKTFDESPITGKAIQLLEGKYGPYLADGETNASLPKDMPIENVTMEIALTLLAERAAAGGSKKKKVSKKRGAASSATAKKKKTTTKSATTKTATKKTTTKKATKKKASKKKAASPVADSSDDE
jgi:DNA topoisomerase-1